MIWKFVSSWESEKLREKHMVREELVSRFEVKQLVWEDQ